MEKLKLHIRLQHRCLSNTFVHIRLQHDGAWKISTCICGLPSAEKPHAEPKCLYTITFRIKQYLMVQRCTADQRHNEACIYQCFNTLFPINNTLWKQFLTLFTKKKVMKKSSETRGWRKQQSPLKYYRSYTIYMDAHKLTTNIDQ